MIYGTTHGTSQRGVTNIAVWLEPENGKTNHHIIAVVSAGSICTSNCLGCGGISQDHVAFNRPRFAIKSKESEPSVEQDREPGKHGCGDTKVEGELTYGSLRNRKYSERFPGRSNEEQSSKEREHEFLKANPPREVIS